MNRNYTGSTEHMRKHDREIWEGAAAFLFQRVRSWGNEDEEVFTGLTCTMMHFW